tara:strand:- start:6006 stop:7148 length:1143 start_codon:yes stop_codon:yes gene_type:complete
MFPNLKSQFMLDPDIIHLNHGSYGACPKSIFESHIQWQKRLELNPTKHLGFDLYNYLEKSRAALSDYIHCNKNDIVYFPNPSTALNTVIKSLDLKSGDEILSSNHEYGALDKTWNYMSKKKGVKYIQTPIPLPLVSEEDFIDRFIRNITNKTKIIFLSHITSSTGLIFPVKKICDIARERNIISIIDGAHVPGHIKLNIKDLDPDIYTGACHKWMCSPKGTAFLYVNKNMQNIIEPLVISWGYESDKPGISQFLDYLEWQGTNDMSSYLTIPDTIKFLEKNNWKNVAKKCRKLNIWARNEINQLLKIDPISDNKFLGQMSSIPMQSNDILKDQIDFYINNKIQLPFIKWHDKEFFRISIQAYNTKKDIFRLLEALDDKYN